MIARGLPALRIVVMAAGFSTRLGHPKALARVHGITLLRRTLSLLMPFAGRSQLIVVIPPRAQRYRIGLHLAKLDFVVNQHRARGLSSSIHLGVKRAWCSAAIMFVPVDLIELKATDIARLISRWRGARRQVFARRIGARAATPLILPRALYRASLDVAGDAGLSAFAGRLPTDRVRLVALNSADADVDTPCDLERARRSRARPWQKRR